MREVSQGETAAGMGMQATVRLGRVFILRIAVGRNEIKGYSRAVVMLDQVPDPGGGRAGGAAK